MTLLSSTDLPAPQDGTSRPDGPSLRDVLHAFFKNQGKLWTALATAIVAASTYVVLAVPIYEAELKVLVKLGKEQVSAIAQDRQPTYNFVIQERTQNINNEIEILKKVELDPATFTEIKRRLRDMDESRRRKPLDRLRLGLGDAGQWAKDTLYWPLYKTGISKRIGEDERLIFALEESIHFELVEESDVIRIVFRWNDPLFAADALNTFADAYLTRHADVHRSERSQDFYIDQIRLYEAKLQDTERELGGFLQKGSVTNLALQKDLLLKEISDAESKYLAAVVAQETTRTRLDRVKEEFAKGTAWVETPLLGIEAGSPLNAALQVLDDSYFKLQDEKGKLLDAFRSDSRQVQHLDSRLQGLRKQKADSLTNVLQSQLITAEREVALRAQELKERQQFLRELSARTIRLRQLERERDAVESTFLLYKNKAEEVRIADDLSERQIGNVRLVNRATPPRRAIWPRRGLVVGLSALVALLLGAAFIAVREFFDHTFDTPDRAVRVLGLPVLLSMPDRREE